MLTFLLGPFLALLPKRWRESLSFHESIEWRIASTLSGFGEAVFALVALLFWYSYSVSGWVSRGMDAALAGKMHQGVTDQEIGLMSLMIFATHPITWVIAFMGVEGSVRLIGAAFAANHLGILPLFVLDKIYLKVAGQSGPGAAQTGGFKQGNLSSYAGALRQKVRSSCAAKLPDELCISREQAEEFLEIRACRRKPDWTPPRTVRYQDTFYRLEACSDGPEPRPFRYRLRRLSAGVMGRTVLTYSPEEEPILVEK
ncbi:MAG TPA: hypothetical protein VFI60_03640 [Candidatus Acidoferrum sp.]|nr:hypothetical protein [Candidatus Acidoferrum sp.]